MEHHDLPANICPRPTASQYQTLVHLTRALMVQVQTANQPRNMSPREAAMYAVDGMAEAWELASPVESCLRAYFAAMTAEAPLGKVTETLREFGPCVPTSMPRLLENVKGRAKGNADSEAMYGQVCVRHVYLAGGMPKDGLSWPAMRAGMVMHLHGLEG
jgi:hypothetical protein